MLREKKRTFVCLFCNFASFLIIPILASQFPKVLPLHKRLVSYFRKQPNLSHSPICLVCVNVYVGRQPATTKGEEGRQGGQEQFATRGTDALQYGDDDDKLNTRLYKNARGVKFLEYSFSLLFEVFRI